MREIKFRVWDAEASRMIYSDKPEDEYNFGFERGALKAWFTEFEMQSDGHAEPISEELEPLMQYTGLKDKNGKECFFDDYCTAKFRTRDRIEELCGRLIEDEFMICLQTNEGDFYSLNRLCDIEVIGNIYEHPELVKP